MGEAKRRKDSMGEQYGKEPNILPWLPINQNQAQQISKWVNRGTWIGISFLVIFWLTIRFIGPAFGWWQVDY